MRTRVINTFCVRFAIAVLLVAPIRTAGAASLPKKITSSDGAPMVLVPAGKFIMGSNSGDDSEEPRRKVYIDGFYIDKYELTNARFRAAGMRTKENYGPKFNGSKQPVAGVTWFQARDYCAKVGKRLPSEAEWEKAARGTDGRKYPWGDSWEPDKVIWRKNSGGKPHPVGRSYNNQREPLRRRGHGGERLGMGPRTSTRRTITSMRPRATPRGLARATCAFFAVAPGPTHSQRTSGPPNGAGAFQRPGSPAGVFAAPRT